MNYKNCLNLRFKNWSKLSPELFYRVCKFQEVFPHEIGDDFLSVSSLSKTPKQMWLYKRHASEIIFDPSKELKSFIGSAIHDACAHALRNDPDYIIEERLRMNICGKIISGQIDGYQKSTYKIFDYKSTTSLSVNRNVEKWTYQLNPYAYLLEEHGYPVKSLEIDVILLDWNFRTAQYQSDYPKSCIYPLELELFSKQQTKEYIEERIQLFSQYEDIEDDDIPECSSEERGEELTWAIVDPASYSFSLEYIIQLIDTLGSNYYSLIGLKDKSFQTQEELRKECVMLGIPINDTFYKILSGAITKKTKVNGSTKNAIKLFKNNEGVTEKDAITYIRESGESEHAIEYRCSVPETCLNFCHVRDFCHYWQKKRQEVFKK